MMTDVRAVIAGLTNYEEECMFKAAIHKAGHYYQGPEAKKDKVESLLKAVEQFVENYGDREKAHEAHRQKMLTKYG